MIEFDCCECGIHVYEFANLAPPEPPLCATCMHVPGWIYDGVLSGILDPGRAWPWPKGI